LHHDELDRVVCRVCEDRAREQLDQLLKWHAQLPAKLLPGAGRGDQTGRVTGATRSAPLPVVLGPLNLIGPGGMVAQLQTVEDDWRRALGWTVQPWRGSAAQTLPHVHRFLLNTLGWACSGYADVADDLAAVRRLHLQVDTVINGAKDPQVPIGTCPVMSQAGVACGERLRVSPFALRIQCPGCGTRWDRDQWLALGAAMRGLSSPVTAVA